MARSTYRSLLACFNSRTPRGGATTRNTTQSKPHSFQLAHPARGCDLTRSCRRRRSGVSTRAPREGVRLHSNIKCKHFMQVSTRAPREGVRRPARLSTIRPSAFQLAHPARGCDGGCVRRAGVVVGFNSRTPRGGATGLEIMPPLNLRRFNSRPPRGGATVNELLKDGADVFQLAHPARGCDFSACRFRLVSSVSTRAPREGVRLRYRTCIYA